jgi:uncharacterized membrane protein
MTATRELRAPARHQGRSRGTLGAAAAAFVIGTAVVAVATSPDVRHALVLATSRQPEPFTQLYFTGGEPPGHTYTPGVVQRVPFTIVNHEGRAVEYSYAIYANGRQVAAPTTRTVDDGAQFSTSQPFQITDQGSRVDIEVRLLGIGESIHYWVTKGPAS